MSNRNYTTPQIQFYIDTLEYMICDSHNEGGYGGSGKGDDSSKKLNIVDFNSSDSDDW